MTDANQHSVLKLAADWKRYLDENEGHRPEPVMPRHLIGLVEQLETLQRERDEAVEDALRLGAFSGKDEAVTEVERLKEQLETAQREREDALRAGLVIREAHDELEEQLEAAESKLRALGLAVVDEVLASNPAPEPDTDPHRCADPDGLGFSETERCNEVAPGGRMLCDREPGHESFHANWRGAEWNDAASSPASRPEPDHPAFLERPFRPYPPIEWDEPEEPDPASEPEASS